MSTPPGTTPIDTSCIDAGGSDPIEERPSPSTKNRRDEIAAKYEAYSEWLGAMTCDYKSLNPAGGRVLYAGGSIFCGDTKGTYALFGPISRKYVSKGGQAWLGYPKNEEQDTWKFDGRWNLFENGLIYHKKGTSEAFGVQGLIREIWTWLHYEGGPLGYPVSDEYSTNSPRWDASVAGRASRFEFGGIYFRSDYALGGRSAADSTWPVMYRSTLENPGTYPDPNAPTLSVELAENALGWTVKASGSRWSAAARVKLFINYPDDYTEIATQATGDGIEVQSDGTFDYDQANASGEYIGFADCVAVKDILTIQAKEVVGTPSHIAVVGLARPSNCTRSEDP